MLVVKFFSFFVLHCLFVLYAPRVVPTTKRPQSLHGQFLFQNLSLTACSAWTSTKTSLSAFLPLVPSPPLLTPFSLSQILSSKSNLNPKLVWERHWWMEAAYERDEDSKKKNLKRERYEENDDEAREILYICYYFLWILQIINAVNH